VHAYKNNPQYLLLFCQSNPLVTRAPYLLIAMGECGRGRPAVGSQLATGSMRR
jgi:hypothetical protein